jgi:putative intracellular protease/amidase
MPKLPRDLTHRPVVVANPATPAMPTTTTTTMTTTTSATSATPTTSTPSVDVEPELHDTNLTMRAPRSGEEHRSSSTSPRMRGAAALPALSPAQLASIADDAHKAMRGSGPFGSGIGVDKSDLFVALGKLGPTDGAAFAAVYQQRHGASFAEHLGKEHFLDKADRARATAYVSGNPVAAHAIEMREALAKGDITAVRALFARANVNVESNAALVAAYRAHVGRDLEYDMRGFADTAPKTVAAPSISLGAGLRGAELVEGLALLHGPRMQHAAERIAALASSSPMNEAARRELYALLQTTGGEERAMLADKFRAHTGRDLNETLRPMFAEATKANDERPITSPPQKTVAVVVSSGNWSAMLNGTSDKHIGGYHWREIEAYVKEALDNGYTPVFFTPDGLPPSPDALSLLQGTLGPKLGFGLMAGTGPDSPQGRAILEGLLQPRSMKSFDESAFATMHIAGGHGSHHDLIGHAHIERAARSLNEAGKPVSAVCHATPALGALLQGENVTGFSPQFDAIMARAGYVLPEFIPPYDAHAGLRALGAKVSTVEAFNIHHTERFDAGPHGAPVMTGTGPEATDNVAQQMFAYLKGR